MVASGSLIPFVALFFSEDFMRDSLRRAGTLAALLAGALATGAHAAGPTPRLADPADAGASVPPTRYQPFALAAPAAAATPSPSQNWKALNQVVASYESMSLTMDMAETAPAEATAPARNPAPTTPQPPAADPHAGHRPKAVK